MDIDWLGLAALLTSATASFVAVVGVLRTGAKQDVFDVKLDAAAVVLGETHTAANSSYTKMEAANQKLADANEALNAKLDEALKELRNNKTKEVEAMQAELDGYRNANKAADVAHQLEAARAEINVLNTRLANMPPTIPGSQ